MSLDLLKDGMNSFLGVLVMFLGLVFIPEIRRKRKYWVSTAIIALIMFFLGVDKIGRDSSKEGEAANTINSLNKNVENLTKARSIDSLIFSEFEKKLEKKFDIVRDSLTNEPKIYNTHIEKADKVEIGNN